MHLPYKFYGKYTDLFASATHTVPPRSMKPWLYVGLFVRYHLIIFNITLIMISATVCDKLLKLLIINHTKTQ